MTNHDLKRARAFLQLTAAQMAALLVTTPRTYWRWEAGTSRIPALAGLYILTLLRYPPLRNDALKAVKP